MYSKEKTYRKQIRFKESVIKAAAELCKVHNRTFPNLLETLVLEAHKTLDVGK